MIRLLIFAIPVTLVAKYLWKGATMANPVAPNVDELLRNSRLAKLSTTVSGVSRTGPQRLENARLIAREFAAAGFSERMQLAAVSNAFAESALVELAIGDGGKSVGLFQLHEAGGGAGMSVEQRKNPTLNTRRIIEETRAAWNATTGGVESLATADSRGASAAELAGLFGYHVERPADRVGAISKRAELSRQLFGEV